MTQLSAHFRQPVHLSQSSRGFTIISSVPVRLLGASRVTAPSGQALMQASWHRSAPMHFTSSQLSSKP